MALYKSKNSGLYIDDEKIRLVITKATTKADLLNYSAKLEKENILLVYSKSKFTPKGKLKSLDVFVKFSETERGNLKAPWLALQFFNFGFEKYTIITAPHAFRIGKL